MEKCECCGEYAKLYTDGTVSICKECQTDHPDQLYIGKGCRDDVSNAPTIK